MHAYAVTVELLLTDRHTSNGKRYLYTEVLILKSQLKLLMQAKLETPDWRTSFYSVHVS